MKYIIASDIHGSARYCRELISAWEREKADRLILLGDVLYHGPRNDIPEEYCPKAVTAMLNERADSIFAVRGNCDAEIDQTVLHFPLSADYALLSYEKSIIFLTHGHIYHEEAMPPLHTGDVLVHGHTHVDQCRNVGGVTVLNPGSVSMPKENSVRGYMTFEAGLFRFKTLDGREYRHYTLGEKQHEAV